MRPGEEQYLFAQQHQHHHHQQHQQQQHQQQQHQQQHQQQQQQQQAFLNSGFPQLHQQQQQRGSNPAAFLSPHYAAQLAALNGLQVVGNGMQMGGGGGAATAMSGMMHRGVLSMPQQNGLLPPQQQQQHQWAQLRPESQAWVSGVFPSSQQGLLQPNLVQQHVQQQQQVAYLQDLRSGSVGLNGGHHLPQQVHPGGDNGLRRSQQQWAHQSDGGGKGQYGGAAPMPPHDSRRPKDVMRPAEFSRGGGGGSHGGGGHSHGNGSSHNKHNSRNDRMFGNWSRGGGGGSGGGGGPPSNPRFKGGKNERGLAEELVRSQQAGASSLRCDACDRTFKNPQQFAAHNHTHIKCDVEGCTFEASGRVVKEHKQSTHDSSASEVQVRSKLLKSKESEEEIARWIEERRRNYPTAKNIQHKAEEMKAKKLRGELVDEDAKKRRERLKEILAKQAELGVPVAEVPSYYMSDRYGSLKGKGAKGEGTGGSGPSDDRRNAKRGHERVAHHISKSGPDEADKEPPSKIPRILAGSNHSSADPAAVRACTKPELEDTVKDAQKVPDVKAEDEEEDGSEGEAADGGVPTDETGQKATGKSSEKLCFFYKRGRCKKGNRCEFSHERRSKKKKRGDDGQQPVAKRAPTLLAKLLESDIRREKSHLLQAFRFFVNNMFLLEFPEKPLKFFEWQESADRTSDAEVGRPDTDETAPEMMMMVGNEDDGAAGSDDDDAETSHAEDDSGELTMLDGEALEVEFVDLLESCGDDAHDDDDDDAEDAEDAADTDEEEEEEDMETLHEEENRSEVVTRSDEEEADFLMTDSQHLLNPSSVKMS